MNRTTSRLLVLSTFSLLAAVSQAGEATPPEATTPFTSTRTAAEVRAEALKSVVTNNGSTGFSGVPQSGLPTEAVKAQTLAAIRAGSIPHGEAAWMQARNGQCPADLPGAGSAWGMTPLLDADSTRPMGVGSHGCDGKRVGVQSRRVKCRAARRRGDAPRSQSASQ